MNWTAFIRLYGFKVFPSKFLFLIAQIEHEQETVVHILLLYICKVKNGTSVEVFLFVTG